MDRRTLFVNAPRRKAADVVKNATTPRLVLELTKELNFLDKDKVEAEKGPYGAPVFMVYHSLKTVEIIAKELRSRNELPAELESRL